MWTTYWPNQQQKRRTFCVQTHSGRGPSRTGSKWYENHTRTTHTHCVCGHPNSLSTTLTHTHKHTPTTQSKGFNLSVFFCIFLAWYSPLRQWYIRVYEHAIFGPASSFRQTTNSPSHRWETTTTTQRAHTHTHRHGARGTNRRWVYTKRTLKRYAMRSERRVDRQCAVLARNIAGQVEKRDDAAAQRAQQMARKSHIISRGIAHIYMSKIWQLFEWNWNIFSVLSVLFSEWNSIWGKLTNFCKILSIKYDTILTNFFKLHRLRILFPATL